MLATIASTFLRERTLCVVDTETSGLSPSCDRIVELALVRVEPGGFISDRFVTLLNIDGEDPGPSYIHGITSDMLVGAPRFADIVDEVIARIDGCVLIAHNLPFDRKFLVAEINRAGRVIPDVREVCTLKAARRHLGLNSNKLGLICDHFGVILTDAHSAVGDAVATAEVTYRLLDVVEAIGGGRIGAHPSYERLTPTAELQPVRVRVR